MVNSCRRYFFLGFPGCSSYSSAINQSVHYHDEESEREDIPDTLSQQAYKENLLTNHTSGRKTRRLTRWMDAHITPNDMTYRFDHLLALHIFWHPSTPNGWDWGRLYTYTRSGIKVRLVEMLRKSENVPVREQETEEQIWSWRCYWKSGLQEAGMGVFLYFGAAERNKVSQGYVLNEGTRTNTDGRALGSTLIEEIVDRGRLVGTW